MSAYGMCGAFIDRGQVVGVVLANYAKVTEECGKMGVAGKGWGWRRCVANWVLEFQTCSVGGSGAVRGWL